MHLTPKQYGVLPLLAGHPDRVIAHGMLLRDVWGPAHVQQLDDLRIAVRSLRQKLEEDPAKPRRIVNEPGVGYRLVFS